MRRGLVLGVCVWLIASACAGLGGGAQATTIRVDYSHDEFASYFLEFFPDQVTVAQGAELVFRQTWTGEPHTVTGGKLADDLGELMKPFFKLMREGKPLPEGPPTDIIKAESAIGFAFNDNETLNQTLSQPCYIGSGTVPKKGVACAEQEQPEFDGTQVLYNSGVIPYEGAQGNEFRMKLADDIKPASYFFYCVVHGALQGSYVNVKPQGAEVDSNRQIARRARAQIDQLAEPLAELFDQADDDGKIMMPNPGGDPFEVAGNFAGLYKPPVFYAGINEFIPKQMEVKAGDPITWNLFGHHTVSFDVPEYFPIIEFKKDGTVARNAKLDPPAGGARKMPEEPHEPGQGSAESTEQSSEPDRFDGGTYDGEGFWSSGVVFGDPGYLEYTMRITKPGTYKYACLIHPPMVGTVEVTA